MLNLIQIHRLGFKGDYISFYEISFVSVTVFYNNELFFVTLISEFSINLLYGVDCFRGPFRAFL